MHVDPGYARYAVQIQLYNDGFVVHGLEDDLSKMPQFTPGLVTILDTHSPHQVPKQAMITAMRHSMSTHCRRDQDANVPLEWIDAERMPPQVSTGVNIPAGIVASLPCVFLLRSLSKTMSAAAIARSNECSAAGIAAWTHRQTHRCQL